MRRAAFVALVVLLAVAAWSITDLTGSLGGKGGSGGGGGGSGGFSPAPVVLPGPAAAPTVEAGGPYSLQESIAGQLAASCTPDTGATIQSHLWTVGDCQGASFSSTAVESPTLTITQAPQSCAVTYRCTDYLGNWSQDTANVTVAVTTVSANAGLDASIWVPGMGGLLNGSISGGTGTYSWLWAVTEDVGAGDDCTGAAVSGASGTTPTPVTFYHSWEPAAVTGTCTFTLYVCDNATPTPCTAGAADSSDTVQMTRNLWELVAVLSDTTPDLNDPVEITAYVSADGDADITWKVDCNDSTVDYTDCIEGPPASNCTQTTSPGSVRSALFTSGTPDRRCQYADEGVYRITVHATDGIKSDVTDVAVSVASSGGAGVATLAAEQTFEAGLPDASWCRFRDDGNWNFTPTPGSGACVSETSMSTVPCPTGLGSGNCLLYTPPGGGTDAWFFFAGTPESGSPYANAKDFQDYDVTGEVLFVPGGPAWGGPASYMQLPTATQWGHAVRARAADSTIVQANRNWACTSGFQNAGLLTQNVPYKFRQRTDTLADGSVDSRFVIWPAASGEPAIDCSDILAGDNGQGGNVPQQGACLSCRLPGSYAKGYAGIYAGFTGSVYWDNLKVTTIGPPQPTISIPATLAVEMTEGQGVPANITPVLTYSNCNPCSVTVSLNQASFQDCVDGGAVDKWAKITTAMPLNLTGSGSIPFTLDFDEAGFAATSCLEGAYTVAIAATDPVRGLASNSTLTLTVLNGDPVATGSSGGLTVNVPSAGSAAPGFVRYQNDGGVGSTLNYTLAFSAGPTSCGGTTGTNWVQIADTSGSLAKGAAESHAITYTNLSGCADGGPYTATITATNAGSTPGAPSALPQNFAVSATVGVAAGTGCDCATSGVAPYCTLDGSNQLTISSGRGPAPAPWNDGTGDTIVLTFASQYKCGKYANGDYWVSAEGGGTVTVNAATPTLSGSNTVGGSIRHGYDLDPSMEVYGCNGAALGEPVGAGGISVEHRGDIGPGRCAVETLPWPIDVSSGPRSFIKGIGLPTLGFSAPFPCENANRHTGSCLKYAAVVTLVNSAPDSDTDSRTDDEFRPGWAGTSKLGPFRTDMLNIGALPALSRAQISSYNLDTLVTFAKIRDRYACVYPHANRPFYTSVGTPFDCVWYSNLDGTGHAHAYTLVLMLNARHAAARFLLDDFNWQNTVHRQALINYVQHGIDNAQQANAGWRTRMADLPAGMRASSPGGTQSGQKTPAAFAAILLNDSALTAVVQGLNWMESDAAYTSGGVAYFGVGNIGPHQWCATNYAVSSGWCAHPSRNQDSYSFADQAYFMHANWTNSLTYLMVRSMGGESIWNDLGTNDSWLARTYRFETQGCLPDPNCGGYINSTGYSTSFDTEMWNAHGASYPWP